MSKMLKEIPIKSAKRIEFVNITGKVEQAVKESKIENGLCVVYCPHTTAAITINENSDPNVIADMIARLNALVPGNGNYSHSEGNSDAHIKSSLLGNEKTLVVRQGKLLLGKWQGIYFCEFDGPRERKVYVSISGSG